MKSNEFLKQFIDAFNQLFLISPNMKAIGYSSDRKTDPFVAIQLWPMAFYYDTEIPFEVQTSPQNIIMLKNDPSEKLKNFKAEQEKLLKESFPEGMFCIEWKEEKPSVWKVDILIRFGN